jgi:lipase chaperone LimK
VRTPRPSAATVRRWREALQAIAGSDVWGVGPEAIRLARAALDGEDKAPEPKRKQRRRVL